MLPIRYDIIIGAAPERVWQELFTTDRPLPAVWGCRLETSFQPGTPYRWVGPGAGGPDTVHVYGEILEHERNRRLVCSNIVGEVYGKDRARYVSRVSYTLAALGECTRVSVVQDQWVEGDPSYAAHVDGGWATMMSAVKTLVETGKPLPLPAEA